MKIKEYVTGKSWVLGLLGNPVAHSVSPQIHNTLSALLGIDAVYVPFKVDKGMLGKAVDGLKVCSVSGFNATIPFKEEILQYVDELDESVKTAGAANTVKNHNGRLTAFNTDGEGFSRAFEVQMGAGFKGRSAVLLGGGGTARTLAVAMAARGLGRLTLVNRTVAKVQDIAQMVSKHYSCPVKTMALEEWVKADASEPWDILVNTTSVGMHPHVEETPVGESFRFRPGQWVYDVIYNPARTRLLRQAEEAGCKTANGMGMLLYQAVLAYEIWMGIKVSEEVVDKLFEEFANYLQK